MQKIGAFYVVLGKPHTVLQAGNLFPKEYAQLKMLKPKDYYLINSSITYLNFSALGSVVADLVIFRV